MSYSLRCALAAAECIVIGSVCGFVCLFVCKVRTLYIAPLRSETPPQKRSGMARVLKGFHSFTYTPTRSPAIGMSHTCLCLPSRSWYSALWVCYHDNSKLRASIFAKLGLY